MQRLRVTAVRAAWTSGAAQLGKLANGNQGQSVVSVLLGFKNSPNNCLWSPLGRHTSTLQGPFAATQSLLEAAQAHQFHSRLEELRQQQSCLNYGELVEECQKSLVGGTLKDAEHVCQALHRAGIILRHGELALLRPEDISDVISQVLPIDEVALQRRLAEAEAALAPLEEQRAALARRVALRSGLFKWGGLGLLVGHFAVFARLTYWELSWDVMEPVGFLVSSFSSVLMYTWFMRTQAEFSWSDAQQRLVSKWEERTYQRAGFPWERHCQLQREIQRYNDMLQAQRRLQPESPPQ